MFTRPNATTFPVSPTRSWPSSSSTSISPRFTSSSTLGSFFSRARRSLSCRSSIISVLASTCTLSIRCASTQGGCSSSSTLSSTRSCISITCSRASTFARGGSRCSRASNWVSLCSGSRSRCHTSSRTARWSSTPRLLSTTPTSHTSSCSSQSSTTSHTRRSLRARPSPRQRRRPCPRAPTPQSLRLLPRAPATRRASVTEPCHVVP
eukprot:Amastigsp_a339454_595.p2 type:complete len:207 gc:universal Amastigsp_a339454_595:637-17(-)